MLITFARYYAFRGADRTEDAGGSRHRCRPDVPSGGVNPDLPLDYYLDVIRKVKDTLGRHIHVRAFSPVELLGMEQQTGMSLRRVLRELKVAGMDSVLDHYLSS